MALLCLLGLAPQGGAPAGAPTIQAPGPDPAAAEKLRVEIDKLRAEIDHLRGSGAITIWAAIIGSIATMAAALVVLRAGRKFSALQTDKLAQDKELDKERHAIDKNRILKERFTAREQHLLKIFKELGNDKERVRMGAIAILLQMLKNPFERDRHALLQRQAIVRALIAVTKHEPQETIQKFIADGLAEALEAVVAEGADDARRARRSPLKDYDFQGACLTNAWWQRIDARGVDFYGATLDRAGLRQAWLAEAVFKNGSLAGATLIEADLRGASLAGASLVRARLGGADLSGADLSGADLTDADLRGATLDRANLRGAILAGAILDGASMVDVLRDA